MCVVLSKVVIIFAPQAVSLMDQLFLTYPATTCRELCANDLVVCPHSGQMFPPLFVGLATVD
jgi:hypothetical protein